MTREEGKILRGAASNAQIDKLGDRLRDRSASDDDFLLLALYRESFEPAYRYVVETIQREVRLPVTGRPGKTTPSIVAKLRRLPTRLSQMQDIAGCRLVVGDPLEQERALAWLRASFPGAVIDDRRATPSHGYRAVHVIPKVAGKPMEIQLRTRLQHLWAELSESLAFKYYVGLKYGEEVPHARLLIGEVRAMREAIISGVEEPEDRLSVQAALENPQIVGRLYDGLEESTKASLNAFRERIESTRGELLRTSLDIQTVEETVPGHQTVAADKRIDDQIQALISRLETLG